ncbi:MULTISPECIES: SRPBCC family protein [Massilia]|uniref:SRPBCC family protein n=1 Tax=Massilia haematophila TaxID=457923 RepID=A0ABV7PH09_9BURK|nr:SRPBCC family protein [Massilia sp.]
MKQTSTETGFDFDTNDLAKLLGGAAAGALLMYMLDPDRGSARRSMSTAAIRNAGSRTGSALGNVWHGIGERVGAMASQAGDAAGDLADEAGTRANRMLESAKPNGAGHRVWNDTVNGVSHMADKAGDELDVAGSRLSRLASQAGDSMMGALNLHGRDDLNALLRNPAVVGGGLLGLLGLMRRSPLAGMLGLAGLALAARNAGGAGGQGLSSLLGSGRGRGQSVELEKSIRIDASPEDVYEMWSNYENFPRFMSHVVEVRDTGRRRSHWVVQGPAGSQFEWDSVLTEQSKGKRLAWRSEPGAQIANAGSVTFEPYRGGTLATVRLSYTPPAGMVGHGLAVLLGADPKRQMDDDLARMKHFIERGVIPRDAASREKPGSRFLH